MRLPQVHRGMTEHACPGAWPVRGGQIAMATASGGDPFNGRSEGRMGWLGK